MQDGDPSQTSKAAKSAMANCNCNASFIQIPPRSPDLNPIENFLHLVRCKLKSDALVLNITKETLQQFKARVIQTIYSNQQNNRLSRLLRRKVYALNIKRVQIH